MRRVDRHVMNGPQHRVVAEDARRLAAQPVARDLHRQFAALHLRAAVLRKQFCDALETWSAPCFQNGVVIATLFEYFADASEQSDLNKAKRVLSMPNQRHEPHVCNVHEAAQNRRRAASDCCDMRCRFLRQRRNRRVCFRRRGCALLAHAWLAAVRSFRTW